MTEIPAGSAPDEAAAAPAAVAGFDATRLCVKNLPKHCDDRRLRIHFEAVLGSHEVSDVRVMKTKEGKSRQFGFVGFRSAEAAARALKHFDKSFFDTSKLQLEAARRFGDDELARPWSRHSKGSSAYTRVHGEEPAAAAALPPPPSGKKAKGNTAAAAAGNGSTGKVHSDPKLAEFLQLMRPKGKDGGLKLWNNDLAEGVGGGVKRKGQAQAPQPAASQSAAGDESIGAAKRARGSDAAMSAAAGQKANARRSEEEEGGEEDDDDDDDYELLPSAAVRSMLKSRCS